MELEIKSSIRVIKCAGKNIIHSFPHHSYKNKFIMADKLYLFKALPNL